jgi:hypothetical protein
MLSELIPSWKEWLVAALLALGLWGLMELLLA